MKKNKCIFLTIYVSSGIHHELISIETTEIRNGVGWGLKILFPQQDYKQKLCGIYNHWAFRAKLMSFSLLYLVFDYSEDLE